MITSYRRPLSAALHGGHLHRGDEILHLRLEPLAAKHAEQVRLGQHDQQRHERQHDDQFDERERRRRATAAGTRIESRAVAGVDQPASVLSRSVS